MENITYLQFPLYHTEQFEFANIISNYAGRQLIFDLLLLKLISILNYTLFYGCIYGFGFFLKPIHYKFNERFLETIQYLESFCSGNGTDRSRV